MKSLGGHTTFRRSPIVRKDYSPRQKLRHWVLIVTCVSLLVGQASLETQAAEQKHRRTHLCRKGGNASNGMVNPSRTFVDMFR